MSDSTPDTVSPFSAVAHAEWQKRGGRLTHVRDVLCHVIEQQGAPFTAESLLSVARSVDKGISMASVYRTLSDLVDFELLHESRGWENEKCFSVVTDSMHQTMHSAVTLVCRDCGKLHPMKNQCLAIREAPAAKEAGFNLRKLDLRIEADCDTFHNTGQCDRAPRKTENSLA